MNYLESIFLFILITTMVSSFGMFGLGGVPTIIYVIRGRSKPGKDIDIKDVLYYAVLPLAIFTGSLVATGSFVGWW